MKVGVTGGAGFIGSHVCHVLEHRGHVPVVLDSRAHPARETIFGDVRDPVTVTEFAAHVDGIIHLAAVLGTQETIGNPRPAAEVNILGAVNVLAAAHQYDLPLVNICVGNHWMRNTYSTTKKAAERLVEQYVANLGLRAGNVRVVNAYGPGQVAAPPYGPSKVRKITPAFVCRALSGADIEVYGDGEQVSDMVHVHDVASVLVRTLEHCAEGRVPSQVLEVGPARHASVNDVAELVADLAAEITGKRVGIVHLPMRPGEQPGAAVTCDPTTLWDLDMTPGDLTPLEVGMAETVDWFHANEGTTWHR